jgi:hypothetical protein
MNKNEKREITTHDKTVFSGHIYLFQAFDIGEDIALKELEKSRAIQIVPIHLAKYFKQSHPPLAVELPHPHETSAWVSTKLYNFGVISSVYKVPFESTFAELQKNIWAIQGKFQEQSVTDAHNIFKRIKQYVTQPKFFHLRNAYTVIQVDTNELLGSDTLHLKNQFADELASLVRFEDEKLSDYQKKDILDSAIGYYRGDLIIIDNEAALLYDDEYSDLLDLFEFANIQQVELRYFDRILDQQLNTIYERKVGKLPIGNYIPFIGNFMNDPIVELGRLKADISVITTQLQGSVKISGEPYYSEIYSILSDKLDIQGWQTSIDNKLEILKDIRLVYQSKIESIRGDLTSTLIIFLIFMEFMVALIHLVI